MSEAVAPITIRHATDDDMPAVVELIRALADFEKLVGPDDAAAARLAADLRRGRYRLLVAEQPERLVGYAMYFLTYSSFRALPSLYLEDLFVLPTHRGRGTGEALLRRLAAEARAEGCGRFEWTVLDWNVGAQRFYQRLGARVLDEWRICRADGAALEAL